MAMIAKNPEKMPSQMKESNSPRDANQANKTTGKEYMTNYSRKDTSLEGKRNQLGSKRQNKGNMA